MRKVAHKKGDNSPYFGYLGSLGVVAMSHLSEFHMEN